jgi:TRAP-type C4-dicarboxylate transport system substrate-binding protein
MRGAGLAVAGLLLAACGTTGPGAGSDSSGLVPPLDKAGGGEPPVTLRLGTAEIDGGPVSRLLRHFADTVASASSGRLTIDVAYDVSHGANDFEAAVISQVHDGTIDMGTVGTRAWEAQGVLGLRAIQAPFLVDGYPVMGKVLSGALSDQLLGSVGAAGYVGLGFLPDQLRHPLGFRKPIVTAADFVGLHIRVPVSTVTDEMMHALGAVPEHLNGPALQEAIDTGAVAAAETSVGNATPFPARSVMTGNLTFFPLVRMLFMTQVRFAALSSTDQAVLRQSAAATQAWSIAEDPESADVTAFCLTGGTFATAADASVAEIVAEDEPVMASLRADSQTRSFIDQISAIKATLAPAAPPACPA